MSLKNNYVYLIYAFISLFLIQVLILNNVKVLGYINPYLYIAFIFIYPISNNRILFLSIAFLLGFLIDAFLDSGGVNAIATTLIAYVRPYFFKIVFQKNPEDITVFSFKEEHFGKVFNYCAILTIIHHFILFFLVNFTFSHMLDNFINTILSSTFTLLLYFMGSYLLRK